MEGRGADGERRSFVVSDKHSLLQEHEPDAENLGTCHPSFSTSQSSNPVPSIAYGPPYEDVSA